MPLYRGKIIDGKPALNWPAFNAECKKHTESGFVVEVREYDPDKELSLQQMKYLHAVVVPLFSNYTGDSKQYWENKLKVECGSKWFKPEIISVCGHEYTIIPSKKHLSVKDFSEWYSNIRDFGDSINCIVPPPDPRWRENQKECE
jgi:hypothetical protein